MRQAVLEHDRPTLRAERLQLVVAVERPPPPLRTARRKVTALDASEDAAVEFEGDRLEFVIHEFRVYGAH